MGSMIDEITAKYDISTFFLIFTFVPIGIGIFALLLSPLLKKLMHGVKWDTNVTSYTLFLQLGIIFAVQKF